MNVKLHFDIEFPAAVWIQDSNLSRIRLNRYWVKVNLITACNQQSHISVAVERCRVFIQNVLSDTVFFDPDHVDTAEKLMQMGVSVTELPTTPVDQIIGMALYCKLNAIMCDKVYVTRLDITSDLGDHVWYQHHDDENLAQLDDAGWWHDPEPNHTTLSPQNKKDKVAVMNKRTWHMYDLAWPDIDAKPNKQSGHTVYLNFDKNETE